MKKYFIHLLMLSLLVSLIGCVQKGRDIKMHFSVDMSHVENVEEVAIIGQLEPLSWSAPLSMSDQDGDGIYTLELTCHVYYNYMEFKFVKNQELIELEGKGNREIKFEGDDDHKYHGIFDSITSNETAEQ